jgi:hypothetical protein
MILSASKRMQILSAAAAAAAVHHDKNKLTSPQ